MDPDTPETTSPAVGAPRAPQQRPTRARKHRAGLHRAAVACERCRERKNKCDGASPVCTPCDKAGAKCIVLDRLTRKPQARDYVDGLERQNEALRARLEALEGRDHAGGRSEYPATDASVWPSINTVSQDRVDRIPLARTVLDGVAGNARSFVGESGGSFLGDVVQTMLSHSGITAPIGSSCDEIDQRDHYDAEQRLAETDGPPIRFDEASLPVDLALRLENAFFEYRWPTLPILHWPSFHSQHMMPFLEMRERSSAVSTFFALLVMAIGAVDLARREQSLRGLAGLLSRVAKACRLEVLGAVDDMAAVQIFVLEALFAISEPGSTNAWHTAGQAVRVAIAAGLHRRDQNAQGHRSKLDIEMRKRIFWCAFAIDQNISMALGRPAAIRTGDIDAELPHCLSDQDLLGGAQAPSPPQIPSQRDMTTFIHTIKLRCLRARIQDTLYVVNSAAASDEAELQRAAIHQELDAWVGNTPHFDQQAVVTYQTTEWFQISYSQSLLYLYRPSPVFPVATENALKVSSENAINFITSYSALYAKNKLAYTWLSLNSLFMASITMLYALWMSPDIRNNTSAAVAKSNVKLCIMLFEVMEETWPLAARCRKIVQRIGDATIKLFGENGAPNKRSSSQAYGRNGNPSSTLPGHDHDHTNGQHLSSEQPRAPDPNLSGPLQQMPSELDFTDAAFQNLDDFFQLDFDMNLPLMTDAFNLSTAL